MNPARILQRARRVAAPRARRPTSRFSRPTCRCTVDARSDAVEVEEHAVRRLGAARRRRRDDRRRPDGVRERRSREFEALRATTDGHDATRSARRRSKDLQQSEVLMLNGHFDFGNGYHGRVYLNPHQLFRHPSTIWRFAQDLLDVLPARSLEQTEVVAGPVDRRRAAGAHDRRPARQPPQPHASADAVRAVHARRRLRAARCAASISSRSRGKQVLLADDVRNTGQTLARCATLVREAGGTVHRDGGDLRPHGSDRRRSACRTSRSPNTRRPKTIRPPRARSARPACR